MGVSGCATVAYACRYDKVSVSTASEQLCLSTKDGTIANIDAICNKIEVDYHFTYAGITIDGKDGVKVQKKRCKRECTHTRGIFRKRGSKK